MWRRVRGAIAGSFSPQNSHRAIAPQNMVIRHEIELYSDDAALVDSFARLIGAILRSRNVAIVVATESHRVLILQRLRTDPVNVDIAAKQRRYIPVDAAEMLSTFMVHGIPDPARCAKALGDLITGADKGPTKGDPRVAICEECCNSSTLCSGDGNLGHNHSQRLTERDAAFPSSPNKKTIQARHYELDSAQKRAMAGKASICRLANSPCQPV